MMGCYEKFVYVRLGKARLRQVIFFVDFETKVIQRKNWFLKKEYFK